MNQDSTNREFGQGTSNADEVYVRDALHVFLEAGSVAELRVPGTHRGTVSGYFDDFGRLALTAARFSGTAAAIYVTINPVNADLLARAKNTTGDADIVRRRWIPIDLDPFRPSGMRQYA